MGVEGQCQSDTMATGSKEGSSEGNFLHDVAIFFLSAGKKLVPQDGKSDRMIMKVMAPFSLKVKGGRSWCAVNPKGEGLLVVGLL